MRSFVVFAAVLVAVCAVPQFRAHKEFIPVVSATEDVSSWSLNALSNALQDPNTPAPLIPYLEAALNDLMAEIMTGGQEDSIIIVTPAGLLDTPAPVAPVAPIPVVSATEDVSSWSLQALSDALQDPNTPAPLIPYLETALNDLISEIFAGGQQDSIIVVTPAGLLDPIVPAPVETPIVPAPVIVAPTPVEAPAQASPLVQIIVNVNQAASAPAAIAPVAPVAEVAPVNPIAVAPVDVIAVNPVGVAPVSPVIVAPVNPIAPAPVDVIAVNPIMPNPVDVVAITPPEFNPIDVVAVGAPEVNPIDIAAPLPVAPVAAAVVGPIV